MVEWPPISANCTRNGPTGRGPLRWKLGECRGLSRLPPKDDYWKCSTSIKSFLRESLWTNRRDRPSGESAKESLVGFFG